MKEKVRDVKETTSAMFFSPSVVINERNLFLYKCAEVFPKSISVGHEALNPLPPRRGYSG